METWAHGQDIADALGVQREPSGRLRHVAHIGVAARAFSYANHGRPAPGIPVRVELTGPSGELWTWGPDGAPDRITGPALGFCLLVTQRRHLADAGLDIQGAAAAEWMAIAQAFAGPPGAGRAPGQFPAPGSQTRGDHAQAAHPGGELLRVYGDRLAAAREMLARLLGPRRGRHHPPGRAGQGPG